MIYTVQYKAWLCKQAFNNYNDAIIYQNALVKSGDMSAKII